MIAFIDESKAKKYRLVAYLEEPSNLHAKRKALTSCLLAGQRSVHFRKESNQRRRHLISMITSMNPKILVFVVQGLAPAPARNLLISALCQKITNYSIDELVFELDQSSIAQDSQHLNDIRPPIHWDHRERHHEPLLWIADAAAWCLNRGGEWERLVKPLIIETIEC